jgi:hypothetical protein
MTNQIEAEELTNSLEKLSHKHTIQLLDGKSCVSFHERSDGTSEKRGHENYRTVITGLLKRVEENLIACIETIYEDEAHSEGMLTINIHSEILPAD